MIVLSDFRQAYRLKGAENSQVTGGGGAENAR